MKNYYIKKKKKTEIINIIHFIKAIYTVFLECDDILKFIQLVLWTCFWNPKRLHPLSNRYIHDNEPRKTRLNEIKIVLISFWVTFFVWGRNRRHFSLFIAYLVDITMNHFERLIFMKSNVLTVHKLWCARFFVCYFQIGSFSNDGIDI